MSTFVLVHGMSHGGWAWGPLATQLERHGDRTIALDLPGHGRRAHDAVVVGHSMGGIVIPRVAERVPSRVRHLVFRAAVVLPHGATLLETRLAPPARAMLCGLARAGDGAVQYPASLEWARWMSDMPPGDARVVDTLTRLTAQPFARAVEYATRLGVTPIDMECAHDPMLSAPDALAKILESL